MQKDLKRLIEGDLTAFDSFYEKTKRSVFYNIYAILKDEQLSEDALQETYIKFLNNLKNLDEKQNILGYLFVISRNIALDMIKKRKREVEIKPEYQDIFIDNTTTNFEYNEAIEKAKKLLNNKEFEILILHTVNELTHKEIAKLLKMPLGTVTWTYNNAIKKLKKGWK